MKEILDIIEAYEAATQQGKQAALATVVHIEGSSYRQPGARMLVTDDGQLTGAISGGCLEGDALRKALLVMAQQKPILVTYDTNDEDDAQLGVGLGCNGIIQILIEPIQAADEHSPIRLLALAARTRQSAIFTTVFNLQNKKGEQPGSCLLQTNDATIERNNLSPELAKILRTESASVLIRKESTTKSFELSNTTITAFTEFIAPPISLVIIGGGNDVMPLVNLAAVMGWTVSVVDGRANYATPQRFPQAGCVLMAKPAAVLDTITSDERTAFVLMTHNYNYDMAMLRQLVKINTPYVGMLGPAKKFQRMIDELETDGFSLSDEELKKIYAPVGFDIGAESSEEIALSIITEIQSVMSGKKGNSLRNTFNPIHEHSKQKIELVKQDNR